MRCLMVFCDIYFRGASVAVTKNSRKACGGREVNCNTPHNICTRNSDKKLDKRHRGVYNVVWLGLPLGGRPERG